MAGGKRLIRSLVIFLVYMSSAFSICSAQENAPFRIVPIRTQFQRFLLKVRPEVEHAYLLEMNGSTWLASDKAEESWEQLEQALREVADVDGSLFDKVTWFKEIPTPSVQNEFNERKSKLKEQLSLKSVGTQSVFAPNPATWEKTLNAIEQAGSMDEEIGFGNEQLIVFAVRDSLSKTLASDASAYVKVYEGISQEDGFFSEPLRSSLEEMLGRMELVDRTRLTIEFTSIEGRGDYQEQLAAECKSVAKELGFENAGFKFSPTNVERKEALELIGSQAPEFTLPNAQNGKDFRFREETRGKLVVLSFWGFTCGPCREEQKFLSQLQAEFGNEIVVIGVNGYGDDEKTVREFIKKFEIEHTLLLGGDQLSQTQYFVTSYPSTFIIGKDGAVKRRIVGFAASDENAFRKTVETELRK